MLKLSALQRCDLKEALRLDFEENPTDREGAEQFFLDIAASRNGLHIGFFSDPDCSDVYCPVSGSGWELIGHAIQVNEPGIMWISRIVMSCDVSEMDRDAIFRLLSVRAFDRRLVIFARLDQVEIAKSIRRALGYTAVLSPSGERYLFAEDPSAAMDAISIAY